MLIEELKCNSEIEGGRRREGGGGKREGWEKEEWGGREVRMEGIE